jgi:hypothetical protein
MFCSQAVIEQPTPNLATSSIANVGRVQRGVSVVAWYEDRKMTQAAVFVPKKEEETQTSGQDPKTRKKIKRTYKLQQLRDRFTRNSADAQPIPQSVHTPANDARVCVVG